MDTRHLFVFRIGEQQLALPLGDVERVARAVEVQALPGAPAGILGAINFQGRIVPVMSLRNWLGLAPRAMDLRDWLIIARLRERLVALPADDVTGVRQSDARDVTSAQSVSPGLDAIAGVLRRDDGLTVICNLAGLLSPVEQQSLDEIVPESGDARGEL